MPLLLPPADINKTTNQTKYNSTDYNTTKHRNDTTYANTTYTPPANYTDYSAHHFEWTDDTLPTVGSSLVLSPCKSERYQIWIKMHQVFRPLMGPFSLVNPSNGYAITVEDRMCTTDMSLKASADEHSNKRQYYYLGKDQFCLY